MGTVRYTTVGGEVIAEKRGGVRRQYVPDPLGSTVALLDNTQAKTDTFRYWPYGEEAGKTGTTPTPLRFVGTLGYYRDNATRSYVRARYLDTRAGRWKSEDPLGVRSERNLLLYVRSKPILFADPTGLRPVYPNDPRFPKPSRPFGALPPGVPGTPLGTPTLPPGYAVCLALYLCITRNKRQGDLASAQHFPGPIGANGGPKDALRHCIGACLIRRNCGPAAYNMGVLDHENSDAPWAQGSWNPVYSPMDLANDERGRKCSERGSLSCEQCCVNDYHNDNLYVLPRFVLPYATIW